MRANRTIILSDDAYAVICGMVQGSEDVEVDQIIAPDPVWDEIRGQFPLADFHAAVTRGGDITYDPEP